MRINILLIRNFYRNQKLIKKPTDKSINQKLYQIRVPAYLWDLPNKAGKLWNN